MATKRKGCGHCWHVTSSSTNGLGRKGWENVTCCWCGVTGERQWKIEMDLRHGPHAQESITLYEPVVIRESK
jgi:hypothetical protein